MEIDNRIREDFAMAQAVVDEFVVGVRKPKITKVSVSTRMTRALGRCKTYGGIASLRYSEIVISKYLLDDKYNRVNRVGTLIHEILHAYFPIDRHGGYWKKYAKMISDNSMFNIETYATDDEYAEFVAAKNRA